MINIDELTIAQAREISAMFPQQNQQPLAAHPYKIGDKVLIRTVTHHLTGILKAVFPLELVIAEAAWIPQDGRFMEAVKTAQFEEVEPFPDGMDVKVGRMSIIDVCTIPSIPRSQK